MIILCHFQAPLLFTICDKRFAVSRTVYRIHILIIYVFLLIVISLCPSKKDLCSSFSLEFFMGIFVRSHIIVTTHILEFVKKFYQRMKNFSLTFF